MHMRYFRGMFIAGTYGNIKVNKKLHFHIFWVMCMLMWGLYEHYSSSAVEHISAVWQAYFLGIYDTDVKFMCIPVFLVSMVIPLSLWSMYIDTHASYLSAYELIGKFGGYNCCSQTYSNNMINKTFSFLVCFFDISINGWIFILLEFQSFFFHWDEQKGAWIQ